MELTPKVFRDVQFREKLRGGYHPEDVDEFLEQAALAAETLQERLRQLTERAQKAEQTANDATATDEALRKMLLIAQRTADQAVREAREESERLLAESKRQATLIVADAEERGRRTYEKAVAEGQERMAELERAVARRQQEVDALQGWVELQKGHLVRVLRDAAEAVSGAGLLSEAPQVPAADLSGEHNGQRDMAADAGERLIAEPAGTDRPSAEALADDDTGEVVDVTGMPGRHSQISLSGEGAGGAQLGGTEGAPREPGGSQRPAETGNWGGNSYSQGLAGAGAPAAPPASGSAPGVVGGSAPEPPSARTYVPTGDPSAPAAEEAQGSFAAYGLSSPSRAPEEDETLAFDERALDSFFSEQELGDERGMGRFRRRS